MSKEFENLLEDLDSGEEVKTKYGICYAYSPDIIEELKKALTELKQIKEADSSKALKLLHTIAFNIELMGITCFGDEFRKIEQFLIKSQEQEKENQELKEKLENQNNLLKKLGFKDEYTFNKIMQIMVDNVFYDDRGERYETPSLYYDNGLCIIDSETGGCGVGIENYGKTFAREFEEIER